MDMKARLARRSDSWAIPICSLSDVGVVGNLSYQIQISTHSWLQLKKIPNSKCCLPESHLGIERHQRSDCVSFWGSFSIDSHRKVSLVTQSVTQPFLCAFAKALQLVHAHMFTNTHVFTNNHLSMNTATGASRPRAQRAQCAGPAQQPFLLGKKCTQQLPPSLSQTLVQLLYIHIASVLFLETHVHSFISQKVASCATSYWYVPVVYQVMNKVLFGCIKKAYHNSNMSKAYSLSELHNFACQQFFGSCTQWTCPQCFVRASLRQALTGTYKDDRYIYMMTDAYLGGELYVSPMQFLHVDMKHAALLYG